MNKNTFQWDAYCLLVDRIPACTGQGGVCVSHHALERGCVYPSMHWAGRYVFKHALGKGVSAQGGVSASGMSAWGCLPGGTVSFQGVFASGPGSM